MLRVGNQAINKFIKRGSIALLGILFALGPVALQSFVPASAYASAIPSYRYTKTPDLTSGGTTHPTAITTDSKDNVFVAGLFSGTVNFAGSSGNDTITAPGESGDSYITKYSSDGSYDWTRVFDTSNGSATISNITTDGSGNIYAVGTFTNTVIFDGLGGSDSISTSSNLSGFLTKINANNSYAYTKVILNAGSGYSFSEMQGIAINKTTGNVYVDGEFNNTQNFEGSDGTNNVSSPGVNSDGFLSEYAADGSYMSTKIMDNSGGADSLISDDSLAIDKYGNIIISGTFYGNVTFDGPGGTDSRTSNSVYGSDAFVTKYNADESYGWTHSVDNNSPYGGNVDGAAVAVDSNGNIYLAGYYSDTANFAGSSGTDVLTSPNGSTYLTKLSPNGTYQYTKTNTDVGASAYSEGTTVAVDSQNNVYVGGTIYETVNFAGNSGSDTQGYASSYDSYVSQYSSDGTYNWTMVPDVGTSNAGEYEYNAVTVDSIGDLYTASDFEDTVNFNSVGGSDLQTETGGSYDTFLSSFKVFTPTVTSSPSATNVATPTAPETGYGVHASSIASFSIYGIVIGLIGLILVVRKQLSYLMPVSNTKRLKD